MARPFILTASGNYFYLDDPRNNEFRITDIAAALSKTCRFGGHTNFFYSVAQHSVIVSSVVPPEFALAGLLHDAAEAYLGDLPRPIKNLLPDYSKLERRVEQALLQSFGLVPRVPPIVKHADLVLLATEKRDLMPEDKQWEVIADITPLEQTIVAKNDVESEEMFLNRFYELAGEEYA